LLLAAYYSTAQPRLPHSKVKWAAWQTVASGLFLRRGLPQLWLRGLTMKDRKYTKERRWHESLRETVSFVVNCLSPPAA